MAIDYGSMYGSVNDVQGFGIGNAPVATPTISFDKPSPAPVTTVSYNPPTRPVGNAPIISPTFPTLKPPTGKPSAGNLTFSFGGGGGGSPAPAAPSNVLTPQTFAPYESTYVPPTPATPVPYDYATAGPYVYGQGLSNAGAAYDIWGSKPGENPYLLSTPADYTPGILGLDPVTLPGNMPNKAADISAFTPATTPRINLGYNDRKDYVAPGDTYKGANHGARKPGGGNPNPNAPAQVTLVKDSTNPAVKAKLAAYRASDTKQTGAANAITSYTNKKSAPVSRPVAPAGGYSTKDMNNSFSTRRDVRNIFA